MLQKLHDACVHPIDAQLQGFSPPFADQDGYLLWREGPMVESDVAFP